MDPSLDAAARFVARLTGPMHFRFILQPIMAIILGIRDGVQDAKSGTPLFIWDLFTRPREQKHKLKNALKRLLIPMIVATVLDGIVQYLLFKEIRILGAVVIGATIMGLPYLSARGLTNRIVSARTHKTLAAGPSRG